MLNASALDAGMNWLQEAYTRSDLLWALTAIEAEDFPRHGNECDVACSGVIAAGRGGGSWSEASRYMQRTLGVHTLDNPMTEEEYPPSEAQKK